jgi:hypothetical protein
MQLHPIKPHGTEGIAKRTPDPLNIKKKKNCTPSILQKAVFCSFLLFFPPRAHYARENTPKLLLFGG